MPSGYPDFEGPKSSIYSAPAWAAVEADDKNFYGTGNNIASLGSKTVAYTVPAGKTLYVTHFAFRAGGAAAGDRDLMQICAGFIYDHTLASFVWAQGGNGGGSAVFEKPFVYDAGETVTFYCTNYGNHLTSCTVSAGGYEL